VNFPAGTMPAFVRCVRATWSARACGRHHGFSGAHLAPSRRLQLLSAPYFCCFKRESLGFWFRARFWSTYHPGIAFVCLVAVISVSLAIGLNPTEGYVLLGLHTYSSMLVAIHYGFLSERQRQRFLSFSGVKQLQARKSFAEDPMTTAEVLSGQPLTGDFVSMSGALLRLVVESKDGTAATLLRGGDEPREDGTATPGSPSGGSMLGGSALHPHAVSPVDACVVADEEGGWRQADGASATLARRAGLGTAAYSSGLLAAYIRLMRQEEALEAEAEAEAGELHRRRMESGASDYSVAHPVRGQAGGRSVSGASAVESIPLSKALAAHSGTDLTSPQLEPDRPLPGAWAELSALPDVDGGPEAGGSRDAKTGPVLGAVRVRPAPDKAPLPAAPGPSPPLASRRASSRRARASAAAWGDLGSFRPFHWRLPARLVAKEIAARASTGASISPRNLRVARALTILAVALPAAQFAVPYGCVLAFAEGRCRFPGIVPGKEPSMWGRVAVFLLAALGAYDSAFVILRLLLRIHARSAKRLQMLQALADAVDFSASLRARLPFVDLRIPENACQWTAALDTLVSFYEARDNVNSYEILSTIMASNVVVVLLAVIAVVLLVTGLLAVQLQSLLVFAFWGSLMAVGLAFALAAEASTNDLLESVSRYLQHLRTLMSEEVTSLRQTSMAFRWRTAREQVEALAAGSMHPGAPPPQRLRPGSRPSSAGSAAGHRPSVIEEAFTESPRDPEEDAPARGRDGLSRPKSKLDILEARAMNMRSTAQSARGLTPGQRDMLASSIDNSLTVVSGKIGELASGAARSRLFGVVISFTLLRGFAAALATTVLSLVSILSSRT